MFPSLCVQTNQRSSADNTSVFPQTCTGLLATLGDCSTENLEISVAQGSNRYSHKKAGWSGPLRHLARLLQRLGRSPGEKNKTKQSTQLWCRSLRKTNILFVCVVGWYCKGRSCAQHHPLSTASRYWVMEDALRREAWPAVEASLIRKESNARGMQQAEEQFSAGLSL